MIARMWAKKPVRISLYVGWTTLFFMLSLVWTYPSDALVAELQSLVSKNASFKRFTVKGASLSGLGIALRGVELVSAKGDPNLPWVMDRVWLGLNGFGFDPKNPAFRFALDAYGGEIMGLYDSGNLSVDVADVDLAQAMPLQKMVKVGLGGQVQGAARLTLSPKGYRHLAGSLELTIDDAYLGPGEVPIPGFGSALSFPKAQVGTLPIDLTIRKGEAELKNFKVTGGDVELAGEGTFKFLGRLPSSRFDLAFDVHATDKLKATQEGKNLLTALDPKSPLLPSRIKRSFSRAGWLGISVTGRLARPRIKVRKSHVK